MRPVSVIGVVFWGTVGILTLIAVLTVTFTRETTGIEERWGSRTAEERQTDLLDPISILAKNKNYQSNVSGNKSIRPTGSSDHDNDGLTNDIEISLGIDPANPDTDGDGVLDGIEKELGTNPNDPKEGGLAPVPQTTTPTSTPNQLVITRLSKTAIVGGRPVHFVTLPVGSTIQFRIRAEATNLGGSHTLVLEDKIPNSFHDFTGTIQVNNSPTSKITKNSLSRYVIRVSPNTQTVVVEINFSVTATAVGNWENIANIYKPNELDGLSDKVYLRITNPKSYTTQPPASCTICNLFLLGRANKDEAWGTRIFAETNTQLDFYISIETSNLESETKTFSIKDVLPSGLKYVPGSGKVFYDNRSTPKQLPDTWITDYNLTTTHKTNRFELYFSATVETDAPFALTNNTEVVSWDGKSYQSSVKVNSK